MKKIAIYARVSTVDQECTMQLEECRRYCRQRGWEVAAEYVDIGESGGARNRPQLDVMMAKVRQRKYGAVVVYRYDRFARSVAQLVLTLDELRAADVDFVSIHEAVDTSTPAGRVMFTILAAFAEFERETIRMRVKSGIDNARKNGVRIGRAPKTWDRHRAKAMVESGMSIRKAAKELGISSTTLHNWLRGA